MPEGMDLHTRKARCVARPVLHTLDRGVGQMARAAKDEPIFVESRIRFIERSLLLDQIQQVAVQRYRAP